MENQGLQIKSETDDVYTIGGYGVVFGEQDYEGQHFAEDTDFWLGKVTENPMLLYAHGQNEDGPGKQIIGRITKAITDKVGLWIEGEIERGREFSEGILELVKQGKLGLSSAAIGYLVDVAKDGRILEWPIVEISLTPTPMEPRTLGVTALRSLAELEPAVKSFLPKEEPTIHLAVLDGQKVIRVQGV